MGVVKRVGAALRGIVSSDATMLAIPGFVVTMAAEYVLLRRRDRIPRAQTDGVAANVAEPSGYELRDTAASLAMGIGMLVVGVVAGRALQPLDKALYRRRVASLGSRRFALASSLVAWDLCYYWSHRLSHEHRVFWAAHVNHHSSRRYNLSTALRQSWTGTIMHWVYLPMLVAGYSPAQVARAGEYNLLYQYWVHTETVDTLPASVERVLNTASHHRVHHGSNPQYLDRNYGGILILWDRLFGTFEPEGERVDYGLTKNIDTYNPMRIAFHEWADIVRDVGRSRTWRDRVGYTLGHPGWQPAAV